MTSMSGVVLMSIIGSPKSLSLVVCIDMASLLLLSRGTGSPRRLGNEADALETRFLHGENGRADALVLGVDIAADMRLRHIVFVDVLDAADGLDLVLQLLHGLVEQLLLRDLLQLPIDLAGVARAVRTLSDTFSGLVVVGS